MVPDRNAADCPMDLAGMIAEEIRNFTRKSPDNRMPETSGDAIFDEPLVKFADGDDPIFVKYKEIIDPSHLTPREALAIDYGGESGVTADHVSVISWILPIREKTRRSNRVQTEVPSRLWSHTRWFGEQFNAVLRRHTLGTLRAMGAVAVAPGLPPILQMKSNEKGLFSNWSERHVAFAAGLGTFGLSDGFITERGIAHRCGSVVCSLELQPSARTSDDPYGNCLHYVQDSCGLCMLRCPAGAITEAGHDKEKCRQYLNRIGYNPKTFADGYDLATSVAGCGLCQTGVSCEFGNPTSTVE